MKSITRKAPALSLLAGLSMLATGAVQAGPLALTAAQMDGVAAGGVDTVTGFVCPVITTSAVLNSEKGGMIDGGYYTIGGPDVTVPVHATNNNGGSDPGNADTFVAPGHKDYTAIWGTPRP